MTFKLISNKEILIGFTVGRTKRKRKEECRGEAGMGYCPFPALGRDIAGGVTTWAAGCAQARRATEQACDDTEIVPATWFRCTHDLGQAALGRDTLFSVATWFGRIGVATHFLVSRHTFWCRDMVQSFGVATWSGILGVAT